MDLDLDLGLSLRLIHFSKDILRFLLNCEHEDCGECLELAEACSGIRFNNMAMLAQVAKRKSGHWLSPSSPPRSRSGAKFGNWYVFWSWSGDWYKSRSGSGSGVRFGCSYWSRSNPY